MSSATDIIRDLLPVRARFFHAVSGGVVRSRLGLACERSEELVSVEREQPHVGGGYDRRRARNVVEQRDLSELFARTERRELIPARETSSRPFSTT